jgi:hypothetical protein
VTRFTFGFFHPSKRPWGSHWIRDWVKPRARLTAVEKIKISDSAVKKTYSVGVDIPPAVELTRCQFERPN